MRVEKSQIEGALLFTPVPHRDERGFFTRTFDAATARELGLDPGGFAQDSQSRTARGIVRGLHLRSGDGEAKIVRCSWGAVFDVVVDLRPESATFRQWISVQLDDQDHRSIYIPAGCAHGFQALSDPADVCYRIDRPHDASEDVTIAWDDPDLAIPWPRPVTGVSDRDNKAPSLRQVLERANRTA